MNKVHNKETIEEMHGRNTGPDLNLDHPDESLIPYRVQRFPEKALVLQDERFSKGTLPALISTRPFSNQFKLKVSQNRDFFPPI